MSLFCDAEVGADDVATSSTARRSRTRSSRRRSGSRSRRRCSGSTCPTTRSWAPSGRCGATPTPRSTDLKEMREGELRTVGGVVTALPQKYTKRGDLMATFVLEDLGAAVEVMVFPKTMAQYGELLEEDAIVCVRGRLDPREDAPKIIAMEVTRPELVLDGGQPVRMRAKLGVLTEPKIAPAEGDPRSSTPATVRCSCTSRGTRRPPSSASATSTSSPTATASWPSSASCSAPTASFDGRSGLHTSLLGRSGVRTSCPLPRSAPLCPFRPALLRARCARRRAGSACRALTG